MSTLNKEQEFQQKVGYFLREARARYTFNSNIFNGSVIRKSAKIAGVNIDTVYKWEKGHHRASLYQLKLLCDFYQTDICELLNKVERGYCEKTRMAE